jgi:hypothetical protein
VEISVKLFPGSSINKARADARKQAAAEEKSLKDKIEETRKAAESRERIAKESQQHEAATADDVTRASGGQMWGEPFAATVRRSLDLQQAGMDRTQATQYALSETVAIVNGMGQQLMEIRNREAMTLRMISTLVQTKLKA